MKYGAAWIAAGGGIIIATIGYFAAVHGGNDAKQTTTVIQNAADSGTNNYAGRDNNHAGRDLYVAGKDLTVNNFYADTSKSKKANSSAHTGDTYSVTSNNQKGGVTTGKYININKVEIVLQAAQTENIAIPDNYFISVDTASQIIKVHPKAGEWKEAFIGVPYIEKETVNPHFISPDGSLTMEHGLFFSNKDSLLAMNTTAKPATKDFYYSMHYVSLPSYIVFGNHSGPLFKAILK